MSEGEMKIEKGIPIPTRNTRRKIAFDTMEVGDSFLTEQQARNDLYGMARRQKIKIATRLEGEKVRVWRIA